MWVELRGEGRRKLMIGVVYVNPEGVGVEEMERLFEVKQVDAMKYEEKGFDVMEDFNTRISVGAEDGPNSNAKRLLDLV